MDEQLDKYRDATLSQITTLCFSLTLIFNLAERVASKPKISKRLLLYKRFDSTIVMSVQNFSEASNHFAY